MVKKLYIWFVLAMLVHLLTAIDFLDEYRLEFLCIAFFLFLSLFCVVLICLVRNRKERNIVLKLLPLLFIVLFVVGSFIFAGAAMLGFIPLHH
ncbi:hypothetical protein [Zooshikella sp. RANM57]|uniref:hypothetical protein n=1 Tax=Zooshikella sp. RANM57 TaxID=3425863 RepID=UPI003D6F6BE9